MVVARGRAPMMAAPGRPRGPRARPLDRRGRRHRRRRSRRCFSLSKWRCAVDFQGYLKKGNQFN